MGRVVDAFSADGSDPNRLPDKENYQLPYADDTRVRLLAIVDGYIKKHGLDAFIPAENRPYEYRNDEERGIIRDEKIYQAGQPKGTHKPPIPSTPDWVGWKPVTEVQKEEQAESAEIEKIESAAAEESEQTSGLIGEGNNRSKGKQSDPEGYSNAALAASLVGRQLGIVQDKPVFTSPREFHEADQEKKQKALRDIEEFIYGSRKLGI